MSLREYKNPITQIEDIAELQRRLVKVCIDFINERNLTDISEVQFNADGLDWSAKYGDWTPATDSHISVIGLQEEMCTRKSTGEQIPITVRALIGEYC